jgi:hypothetical protein
MPLIIRSEYGNFLVLFTSPQLSHFFQTVIRHKTSQYLDVTKSLRQQDKSRIRTARLQVFFCSALVVIINNYFLNQISKSLPFLQRYYHASWPIHPVMKQYLSSSSKAYKKAQAHLNDLIEVPGPFAERLANNKADKVKKTVTPATAKKSSQLCNNDSIEEDDSDSDSESSNDDDEWEKDLEDLEENNSGDGDTDEEPFPVSQKANCEVKNTKPGKRIKTNVSTGKNKVSIFPL